MATRMNDQDFKTLLEQHRDSAIVPALIAEHRARGGGVPGGTNLGYYADRFPTQGATVGDIFSMYDDITGG